MQRSENKSVLSPVDMEEGGVTITPQNAMFIKMLQAIVTAAVVLDDRKETDLHRDLALKMRSLPLSLHNHEDEACNICIACKHFENVSRINKNSYLYDHFIAPMVHESCLSN